MTIAKGIRDALGVQPGRRARFTPAEKLYDAFIAFPAGAESRVELNTHLRAAPGPR